MKTLITIASFYLLLFLVGCSAQNKLERKINKAKVVAYENPESFADLCARLFPVKDSVGTPVIKIVKADNKDYSATIDSLTAALNQSESKVLDSTGYRNEISRLKNQVKKFKDAYKPCLPDTVRISTPIYKENTARVSYLNNKLNSMSIEKALIEQDRDKALNKARNHLNILIVLSAALFGVAWLAFRK